MASEKHIQSEEDRTAPSAEPGGRRKRWRRLIVGLLLVAACGVSVSAGGLAGFFAGRRSPPAVGESAAAEAGSTLWTCSMHPQIKLPKPGKCPICFMDLIPLQADSGGGGPRQLKMSNEAVGLANIRTERVKREYVAKLVRMVGKVDYDETRLADITSWIPNGRLDELFVDYTNTTVRTGDHLFSIYSPDLVIAQRELLLNSRADSRSPEVGSGRRRLDSTPLTEAKLRRWGLLDEQIEEIKLRGTPSDHVTIYAPLGGVVIGKHANEGAYVKEGTKIYTIADLSQVWIFLDAYESDEPWLRYGQEVEFTTESYPGEPFKGRIALIDPVLDERTRTVKVRVNVPNEDRRLKPGMFVHAIVRSKLAAGGRVLDASLAGKWICPMHPEIVKDEFGACDVCGMALEPAEKQGFVAPDKAPEPPLVIPATAPLRTGKRAVVYVKRPDIEEPTFEGREVLLGDRVGEYYIVVHGLKEGEKVVTSGNFKIDSALQIQARPSMMSPQDALATAEQTSAELEVPERFRAALGPLYESYLGAADALADDDLERALKSVRGVLAAVDEVDAVNRGSVSPFAGLRLARVYEILSRWQEISDRIVFAAQETKDSGDRATARRHFDELSGAVVWLMRSFGHTLPEPVYRVHCPMAFDGKGADWLQTGREIRNPYFDPTENMLQCGDKTATFHGQTLLQEVPDGFRKQLTPLYGAYLKLQQALADDRLKDALAARGTMSEALDLLDSDGLDDRAAGVWQAIREDLLRHLAGDLRQAEIEEVRKRFEKVSATILSLITRFGHAEDAPLQKAFCPMAFNDKGAFWLQSGKKIDNPYFGHEMRTCGEIRRTFAPRGEVANEENPVKEEPQ